MFITYSILSYLILCVQKLKPIQIGYTVFSSIWYHYFANLFTIIELIFSLASQILLLLDKTQNQIVHFIWNIV